MPQLTGRPSKQTPATVDTLLKALREGHSRKGAAALAGISEHGLQNWLRESADFLQRVESAESDFVERILAVIVSSALQGDVRSAQWLLERRQPLDWAVLDRLPTYMALRDLLDLQQELAAEGIHKSLAVMAQDYERIQVEKRRTPKRRPPLRALPAPSSA